MISPRSAGCGPQSCSFTMGSSCLPSSLFPPRCYKPISSAGFSDLMPPYSIWLKVLVFWVSKESRVTIHIRQYRPGVSSWDIFPDTVVRQTVSSLKSQSVQHLHAYFWYLVKGLTWKGAELSQLSLTFKVLKNQVKVTGVLE